MIYEAVGLYSQYVIFPRQVPRMPCREKLGKRAKAAQD